MDFRLFGALNFAVDLVGAFVEFRADLISAQFVQNRLRFVSKASIRSQIFVQACLHRESTSASDTYGIELRFELFRLVTSLTSDVRGSTAKSRRWVAFIAAEVTTIHRTVKKAAQTTSFLLKTFIAKRFRDQFLHLNHNTNKLPTGFRFAFPPGPPMAGEREAEARQQKEMGRNCFPTAPLLCGKSLARRFADAHLRRRRGKILALLAGASSHRSPRPCVRDGFSARDAAQPE